LPGKGRQHCLGVFVVHGLDEGLHGAIDLLGFPPAGIPQPHHHQDQNRQASPPTSFQYMAHFFFLPGEGFFFIIPR
jgi:hypothetical protein